MKVPKELPEKIIESREACLSHADDLIRAAKRVLSDENLPHISYHLATLALEEVGKSILVVMDYVSGQSRDEDSKEQRFYDDHIKKLFWATWDPLIGHERITGDQIESFRGLSRRIHDTRLQSLYVDFDERGPLLPSEAVTKEESQVLIDMTSARIEMEKLREFTSLEGDRLETLSWFLAATEDSEKRRLIFGSKSMQQLVELSSVNKWLAWVKGQFDEADKEAQEFLRQELGRNPSVTDGKDISRWKIKIRLFTSSHSIRPKALNKWNENIKWIKLYPVGGKKNQLLAEFILPKSIPLQSLWKVGWSAARRFVLALNIGSLGCFWWQVPEQISRYYEKIVDLEAEEMDVKIERSPALKLDWNHRALSDQDLWNTVICLNMMPDDDKSFLGQSMAAYIKGLTFLNKTDIHWQFEVNCYEFFYESLGLAKKHFNKRDEQASFRDQFIKILRDYALDAEELKKHEKIVDILESGQRDFSGITLTLSEVALIKIMCDAYLIKNFRELVKERKSGS